MTKYEQAERDIEGALQCFQGSAGNEDAERALENIKWALGQVRVKAGVALAVEVNTYPIHSRISKQQAFELLSEMADGFTMALPVFLGLKGSDVPVEDVEMFATAIGAAARKLEEEYLM